MLRPSITATIALSLFAVTGLTGCKTIYTDMYRPKRNHFKPDKETARPTELLPENTPALDGGAPPPAPAPALPGLDPGAAPAPAPDAAAPPAAPPAIPGL